MKNLNEINGIEIVEFLNNLYKNYELEDYQLNSEFEFVSQEIKNEKYELYLNAYYNNWGESQETDLILKIWFDEKGVIKVYSMSGEPLEGNGLDDELEDLLLPFLKEHKFQDNVEEIWMSKMRDIYEQLPSILFSDTKAMKDAIDSLKNAHSLMK